jgi:hypothetical protein
MNVLYIGPYTANNDHGDAARYILRSLAKQCNLTSRAIYLYSENMRHEEFEQYEDYKDHFDVIIQDVPAFKLDYEGGVKNIAICHQNTRVNYYSTIISRLNLMDEVWCINESDEVNLKHSGLDVPLKTFPIQFELPQQQDSRVDIHNPKDSFIFGWIGEPSDKDDLESFLTAFHAEFDVTEPVAVLINIMPTGIPKIGPLINSIKQRLRLYNDLGRYAKETVMTLPFEHLWRIESVIGCLVRTTHGETHSKFTNDFYLSGKPIIVPIVGSSLGHVESGVPVTDIPCMCSDAPLNDVYTGRERWYQVDINSLMSMMREVYETRPKFKFDRNIDDLNNNRTAISL